MKPHASRLLPVLALGLAACAPTIRHQIITPPPSAPRAAFQVEAAEVQSREVGDDAWRYNKQIADHLTQALERALDAARKPRARTAATPVIRSRVYLAYGEAPVRARRARAGQYIEVRLELVEPDNQVRYSTFTKVKLQPTPMGEWFGVGADVEETIREVLQRSAEDFISRL